jgi:phosphate transporter
MTKALLLGIALSSNIGGAASPIASPQNLIALQNMNPEPSWGVWFFVALPVCIISILCIWGLLLLTFQPGRGTTIVPIRPMKDKFSGTQWFISIVTVVTIVLWCVSHQLEPVFGDMGVVAIIPLVLFFGTGILTKEDFNNFLWTIIILAAGGLALGKSVNSSGLLHTIAESITMGVEGMSLYGVLVVFCALILVVATFISHTVAALIVLPLVQQVGQQMAEPHPNLLVMGAVLMASGAMGLPTSGFPNMSKSNIGIRGERESFVLMCCSCYHDGGPTYRTAILGGQALLDTRHSGEYYYVCGYHHGGLWAHAGCWFLDVGYGAFAYTELWTCSWYVSSGYEGPRI